MEEIKKQTSNIDEEGNVLYLDEERLKRKEVPFPPFKNKPNGLGIYNFIKEHIVYMSNTRWPLALRLYKMFIRFSGWLKQGGWKSEFYKRVIMIAPDMETNTSTVVMPLNVDVTDEAEKVVIPMDLIKESLRNVTFIGGMDGCLCREANDCSSFPHDVGCLFLGEAGRVIVKHGLGRELSYEEACARVDLAAKHGLMGQAVWIEVEQLLWGIRNDQMDKFLEICFCCPCCCIAMRLSRAATPKERHRFHPAGWTAVPDRTKCIGCNQCVTGENGCPVEAITFGEDGKVVIDQEICVGCGICRTRCPVDAIQIKQTMPMRKNLHDYFEKDFNIDLKIWDEEPEEPKSEEIKILEVKQSVFADNDKSASDLREFLKEKKTFLLNLMSSPGSGKTSTLRALAKELAGKLNWAVMEADIDSAVDAEAMQNAGVRSIQLHTGGMCHLDADMTRQGLQELGTDNTDLVVLENVGNLVCPAEFDTGACKNMTILSVPEGDDKPLKYPLMYETCDLLVINKIDVMEHFDFDKNKVIEYAKIRNPNIEIMFISAKTGEGIPELADWICCQTAQWKQ